ncbi:MAG: hypothetical protein JWQ42_4454 [Edaphobacter sp.]|nr:hypothetical protein [Edaphobacter sp.]
MIYGTCPKCNASVMSVNLKEIKVNAGNGTGWIGVSYQCALCNTVLSVGIDPVALKTDTIKGVLKGLGKT